MQATGNKDPMTGKDEYVTPDGMGKVFLSPDEYSQLMSQASPVNVDLNVGSNYAGPPTTLQSSVPTPAAPPSQLGLATAGFLGTDLATLEGRNRPTTTPPLAAPAPTAAPMVSSPIVDTTGAVPVPLAAPAPMDLPSMSGPGISELSETSRTRKNVSPELSKKENAATAAMQNAIVKESEANTAVAEAQTQSALATAAREKQFVDQEAIKQAKEQTMIAERQAKLDALSDQYSNMKIDSNNFWANKSTGDSILAALALGLGAFGQVGSGDQGVSPTLKILQSKIDQDIEIQKANISKAGQTLESQRGLYSDILRQTGDERVARLKTHELGLNAVKAEYSAIAAKSGSDLVKARALKDISAMDQQLVQNKIEQAGTITTSVKDVVNAQPKPLTGTKFEQSTGDKLGSLVQSVAELDGLEKLLKNGTAKDEVGPIVGRLNDWKSGLGLPLDESFSNAKTRSELIYLVTKKYYTGLGSGVRENEAFQKLVPQVKDDYDVMLFKLKELRKLSREQYANAHKQESSRYNDPNALTGSFPTPAELGNSSNSLGFKPKTK